MIFNLPCTPLHRSVGRGGDQGGCPGRRRGGGRQGCRQGMMEGWWWGGVWKNVKSYKKKVAKYSGQPPKLISPYTPLGGGRKILKFALGAEMASYGPASAVLGLCICERCNQTAID
jgi:hypothetical protein